MLIDTAHSTLDWEPLLASAAFAYNCHIHRSTKESPFFLTYLHDPRLPVFDLQKPRQFADDSFVHETFMIAQKAFMSANEHMQGAAEIQKKYYDQKVKEREVRPGERVMVYFPNPPPKVNPKLHSHWKPGTVIKKVGNLNVLVGLDSTKRASLVHLNRVKAFREEQTEHREQAIIPEQEPVAPKSSKKEDATMDNIPVIQLPEVNFDFNIDEALDEWFRNLNNWEERERQAVTNQIEQSRREREIGAQEDALDQELAGPDEDRVRKIRILPQENLIEWVLQEPPIPSHDADLDLQL